MHQGGLTLLVVEDNPADSRLLAELLRDAFAASPELVSVHRLGEARAALLEHEFDCALIDLSLPDAEGLEVVEAMASDASTVPLVVISGQADEAVALSAVQAGAQDYLVKGRLDEHAVSRTVGYAIERKRLDRELAQLALYDPLTGLPNRALFLDRLTIALARAQSGSGALAVVHVDLDDFAAVNARWGRPVGDAVLIEIAQRLGALVPAPDTAARVGGDSFAIAAELDVDAQVSLLAGRVVSAIGEPVAVGRDGLEVGASAGFALARRDDRAGPLLGRAAVAMYIDKGRGAELGR